MNSKFFSSLPNKFHNYTLKTLAIRERTIGWPPLIISGPQGVGKTTLKNHLLKKFPSQFELNVPYTTRQPSKNERHGYDYFFIETETFENDLKNNKFLEYSKTNEDFYGTRRDTVTHIVNSGKICLLQLDTRSVMMALSNGVKIAYRIFITPPNLECLNERLRFKYPELNDQQISRIVFDGSKEIEMANHLNVYHYMLENRDKEVFLKNVNSLIKNLYPFIDAGSDKNLNRKI